MSADFTHVMFADALHRDTGWITQEVCQEYAKAIWDDGGNMAAKMGYADNYLLAITGANQDKIILIKEMLLRQSSFKMLLDEVREELGIPQPGSIEWNIWMIQQRLDSGKLDGKELAALYSRLFELQGWAAKPHERAGINPGGNVGIDSDGPIEKFDRFNTKDIERKYWELIASV